MATLLRVSGLAAGYHGHPIVEDLDLEVRPGEVVALLGPNGAGKTTTLLTLAGSMAPIAGDIWYDGVKTAAPLHRLARRGLGFVTEERSVFMHLTAGENLRVGRCDVDQALTAFPELKPLLPRRAGLLSGGEQQILSLARALARKPRLLLADELSLGLAPIIVNRLLGAVRAAANAGIGVLLVEQHIHQVLQIADRVYVLRRGRVVLEGTPDELRDKLEDSYLSGGEEARAPLQPARAHKA